MYSLLASNAPRPYQSFLDDLSPSEAHRLIQRADVVLYNPGDYVIKQGEEAHHVYLVHQGHLHVERDGFAIAEIHPGGYFGLMSLFDHAPRSADVVATESSAVYRIRYDVLRKPEFSETFQALSILQIETQQSYLRNMNNKVVDGYREKLKISEQAKFNSDFLIRIMGVLIIFQFVLGAFLDYTEFFDGMMGWIFTPICIFGLGLLCWYYLKSKKLNVHDYGWNFDDWWRQIPETLVYTIAICACAVLFKYALIHYVPSYAEQSLFVVDPIFTDNWMMGVTIYLVYIVLVPIQEFTIRGVFQSGLTRVFMAPGNIWKAILLSNIMFCAFHLHQSFLFALVAFLPGLVWGYLYHRQNNLACVTISHILVGVFCLLLLGIV